MNVKVERGEEGNLLEKVKGQRREMKASERDINRVCKRCPGAGCGAMIFKIDGCRHMTCELFSPLLLHYSSSGGGCLWRTRKDL